MLQCGMLGSRASHAGAKAALLSTHSIERPWHVLSSAVQLHELDAPLASVFTRRQRQRHTVRWTPDDRPQQIDSHTTRFTCHTKRVKAGSFSSAYSSHRKAI